MARQLLNTGANKATWDANITVDRQANLMMQPRPPWNNEYATEYCLRECGFTAKKERTAWHNEGLYDLADFLILTEQDIQDVCGGFKKLAGRASFHPGIARTLTCERPSARWHGLHLGSLRKHGAQDPVQQGMGGPRLDQDQTPDEVQRFELEDLGNASH